MTAYLIRRAATAIVVLFGVSVFIFLMLHVIYPTPAIDVLGPHANKLTIAQWNRQHGFDEPWVEQYLRYINQVLHGNLGYSYVQHEPALTLLTQRLPYTINLTLAALAITIVFGVGAGMIMALTRGGWGERILMPLVLAGQAMPAFWTGILLILVFSVTFHWLPSSGDNTGTSLILPAITLASLSAATVARITRGAVLEQLSRDYVRTARSKGAGTWRLIWRHLLRNVSVPVLTVLALETANLLGGAVVTEEIFAWPGIGQLTIQSVNDRDFPVVQAIVIFAATIYIVINLATDIVYGFIDPRIAVAPKEAR